MPKRTRWMTAIVKAADDSRVRLPWERGLRRSAMIGRRAPAMPGNGGQMLSTVQ